MQPFCSVILCWSFTCSDMAITSFLNIFEVTPYMIVSEQDSETSLNRRKPRPPADAASIWIRFVDRNVSGAIGRCWHTLHGNFTPCGSHRLSPLPATARDPSGHFNARTEAGQSYLPDIRVIAPDQPRSVCARKAAPPIPPFSSWDRGLLNPARLSFRAHIGCIQCTYSVFKLSPARTDAPLPIHSCRMVIVSKCVSN